MLERFHRVAVWALSGRVDGHTIECKCCGQAAVGDFPGDITVSFRGERSVDVFPKGGVKYRWRKQGCGPLCERRYCRRR